jgi:hypothetical protein
MTSICFYTTVHGIPGAISNGTYTSDFGIYEGKLHGLKVIVENGIVSDIYPPCKDDTKCIDANCLYLHQSDEYGDIAEDDELIFGRLPKTEKVKEKLKEMYNELLGLAKVEKETELKKND